MMQCARSQRKVARVVLCAEMQEIGLLQLQLRNQHLQRTAWVTRPPVILWSSCRSMLWGLYQLTFGSCQHRSSILAPSLASPVFKLQRSNAYSQCAFNRSNILQQHGQVMHLVQRLGLWKLQESTHQKDKCSILNDIPTILLGSNVYLPTEFPPCMSQVSPSPNGT